MVSKILTSYREFRSPALKRFFWVNVFVAVASVLMILSVELDMFPMTKLYYVSYVYSLSFLKITYLVLILYLGYFSKPLVGNEFSS